jgi:hypothetical protein
MGTVGVIDTVPVGAQDDLFFTAIADLFADETLFRTCGFCCLTTLYNCLVAYPEKAIVVFKNDALRERLVWAQSEGVAKVKQITIDIVNFLIVHLPGHWVLECAEGFDMLSGIPLILELGVTDNFPTCIAAASRIIDVLRVTPRETAAAARERMALQDVVEPLNSYLETCTNPNLRERGEAYLRWIEETLNETDY